MTDKDKAGGEDHLSVRLNEAFERLERQHDENLASAADVGMVGQGVVAEPGTSISGVLGVLLSLIAMGIASYAAWNVYLQSHKPSLEVQLQARVETLQQQVNADQAILKAMGKELKKDSDTVDAMQKQNQKQLTELRQQLTASMAQVEASLGTSSKDWLFAEVEYLLRLANQRVLMEGNVKGALALFRDADKIVRQAAGITAFDLRKAIAGNIAQLEAVKEVDTDGIYLRLGALVDQIPNLRQRQLKFSPGAPSAGSANEPAPTGFGARLLALTKRGLDRILNLVDFRRDSERIRPILPPKEEYYLRQNLVLKLQMAQLGLLRGDEQVYTNSLREAQSWLVSHFDAQDTGTTAMAKALAELQGIDISRKMPDVSSSLKEVKKLMADFHQQPPKDQPAQ